MTIMILGIDLGKNSCSVAGLDADGKVVLRGRMQPKTIVGSPRTLRPARLQWRPAAARIIRVGF